MINLDGGNLCFTNVKTETCVQESHYSVYFSFVALCIMLLVMVTQATPHDESFLKVGQCNPFSFIWIHPCLAFICISQEVYYYY